MPLSYICFNPNSIVPAKITAIPYYIALLVKYCFKSSNTSGLNSAEKQSFNPFITIKDPNPAYPHFTVIIAPIQI